MLLYRIEILAELAHEISMQLLMLLYRIEIEDPEWDKLFSLSINATI